MRVLDYTGRAADQFPRATVHPAPDGEPYDVVITGGELCRRAHDDALAFVHEAAQQLVIGGEMHVLEPSAEWASREIRAGQVGPVFQMHCYGSAEHPRRSLYTLEALRQILNEAGLITDLATTRPYEVARTEAGDTFMADQHYLVGIKLERGGKTWMSD